MTHPTPPPDARPDPTPQRLGVVLGDRLCARCGFNLHGQPITREPHYQMLAVRCPECSTMASLQEYPVLGVWAQRFGLVLALGWALVALLASFLTGVSIYGISEGAAGVATTPAARQIGEAFAQYRALHLDTTNASPLYSSSNSWYVSDREPADNWIDPDWLAGLDLATLTGPTPRSRYNPRAAAVFIPAVLVAAAWGVVWSVLLLHRRVLGRTITTAIIFAAAGAFVVLTHSGSPQDSDGFGVWSTGTWGWGVPARNLAARMYGLAPALVTLTLAFGAFTLGHAYGRPVVRGVLRLLLPPRLRGPLAVLWHIDGLPSPPTRADAWLRG